MQEAILKKPIKAKRQCRLIKKNQFILRKIDTNFKIY
jgi:hypothetical protein